VFTQGVFPLKNPHSSTLEPGQPQRARPTAYVTAQQCFCTSIASLRVHYQKGREKIAVRFKNIIAIFFVAF